MNKNQQEKWYDNFSKTKNSSHKKNTNKSEQKNKITKKNESAKKSSSQKNYVSKQKKADCDAIKNKMFNWENVPIESQQILNTFNDIVSDIRNLNGKQKIQLPGLIKKLSHQLTDDRNSRRLGYMNDNSLLSAYISYFMWWNLVRLTKLFSNLPKNAFQLNDKDVALDIGSGPLTVPIALWLARPELRDKKLTFYCMDLSQIALTAGEELYLSIAAKTIKNNQEPWKIIRIKGPLGTQLKQTPSLITCANVFNEIIQNIEMPADFLAKKYTKELTSYFDKDSTQNQTILVIEPGDPHSARLVSLMRDAFMRNGFLPISPCTHSHSCPMEGRTTSNPSGKWCNFAFNTEDSPEELKKLSSKANLTKERAVLSYVLMQKNIDKTIHSEENTDYVELRITSDFIKLPEIHKSGYYCCSKFGLVLAIDKSNIHPSNGDLIRIKTPKKIDQKDKKTGAPIIDI